MVTLTSPIANPNMRAFELIDFGLRTGTVTVRGYFGSGQSRARDFIFSLSDTAGRSGGLIVNSSPGTDNDTLLVVTPGSGPGGAGVGLINALSNAITAYRGAANHNAGLKALELRGVTDGWLGAELAGT